MTCVMNSVDTEGSEMWILEDTEALHLLNTTVLQMLEQLLKKWMDSVLKTRESLFSLKREKVIKTEEDLPMLTYATIVEEKDIGQMSAKKLISDTETNVTDVANQDISRKIAL